MLKMIDWACDSNVLISFDREPIVQVRVIKPNMSIREKKSIAKYPFTCKKPLKVMIYDNKKFKQYNFEIKEGYCWDGMTIPRFAWSLIGVSREDNRGLVAGLVHDVLCENHEYIDNDRQLSSNVFRALLIASGVSELKANIMYFAVDNFQKFCGWERDK